MQTDLELKVRRKKEKLQQSNFNLRSRAVETWKKCTLSNMALAYKLINPKCLFN